MDADNSRGKLYNRGVSYRTLVFVALSGCVSAPASKPVVSNTLPAPYVLSDDEICSLAYAVDDGRMMKMSAGPAATFVSLYRGNDVSDPRASLLRQQALCLRDGVCAGEGAIFTLGTIANLDEPQERRDELAAMTGCAPALLLAAEYGADVDALLLQLDGDCRECLLRLARREAASAQYAESAEHYARYLGESDEDTLVLQEYAAVLAQFNEDQAADVLRKVHSRTPDAQTTRALLALVKEPSEQKPLLLTLVEQDPLAVDAWRALVRVGNNGEKQRALEQLVALQDDGAAHMQLGRLHKKSNPEVALFHFGAAAKDGVGGATSERKRILRSFGVSGKSIRGRIVTVARRVRDRVKDAQLNIRAEGYLDIRLDTDDSGAVTNVVIERDTMQHSALRRAVVGNLAEARVRGGANAYTFRMEFLP